MLPALSPSTQRLLGGAGPLSFVVIDLQVVGFRWILVSERQVDDLGRSVDRNSIT